MEMVDPAPETNDVEMLEAGFVLKNTYHQVVARTELQIR